MSPITVGLLWVLTRVAIVAAAFAGVVLACGCAFRYPPADRLGGPERPHPTAEQIAALVRTSTPVAHLEAPFELRFFPAVVLAGGATWQTCHVPTSWNAVRVATAFEGKFASDVPADRYQPRLVESIPCGKFSGVCAVLLPNGDVRRIERAIESRGECNSGGRP